MKGKWRGYPEMDEIKRLIVQIGEKPSNKKLLGIVVKQLEVIAAYKPARSIAREKKS